MAKIIDIDPDVYHYLVTVERDGVVHKHAAATASGIADMLADQAYQAEIGEEPDTVRIWRFTDVGPVPVTLEHETITNMGMVSVDLQWRVPGVRGKAGHRHERVFYKIVGA